MPKNPTGKRVHAKLYMAGQRVPLRSFVVQAAVNSHLTAQIEIPPTPLATGLKPRTLVHVVTKESREDPYVLMFEGEYVANTLRETTGNKGFVLQCAGLTNYWDTTYQYFLKKITPAGLGEQETAAFMSGGPLGEARSISSVVIALPEEIASDYIAQALTTGKGDIQQAILNAVSLMANVSTQNGDVSNPRINSQIERAYVNLRLGERVSVLPDHAVKSLIDTKTARALIEKMTGTLSDFSTLAGIVSAFLAFAYYDWVPIAAPSYTPRNSTGDSEGALDFFQPVVANKRLELRGTASSITSQASVADASGDAKQIVAAGWNRELDVLNVQRDVIFKPKTFFLPPPTCNLVFPCQYDSFSSHRQFLQEPTRMRIRVGAIPGLDETSNSVGSLNYYAPPEIKVALQRAASTSKTPIRAGSLTDEPAELDAKSDTVPVQQYETLVRQTDGDIDETITGVIPVFEELGFAEYAALSARKKGDESPSAANMILPDNIIHAELARDNETPTASITTATLHQYLANAAQYRLDLRRASQRTVEGISGPYNQNLVVGFPGLVFSKTAIFAGEIVSLNSSCVAQGQAVTVFTLGLVRELSLLPAVSIGTRKELALLEAALVKLSASSAPSADELKKLVHAEAALADTAVSRERMNILVDGFDPVDKFPNPPEWISESYRPERIAEDVYRPFFGTNVGSSITASGVDSTKSNQVIAANVLFLRYLLATDKVAHAAKMTKRNIATAKQVLTDFLGLGEVPSEDLPERSGGPYTEDLTKRLGLGASIPSQKAVADDDIEDPYSPFAKSQVDAVRRYVAFISKSRGFRG